MFSSITVIKQTALSAHCEMSPLYASLLLIYKVVIKKRLEVIRMAEIEGFDSIISTLTLAKELHDIDRFDIVQEQFFDTLHYDSYYENIFSVIQSVFSGFHSTYDDDDDDAECMIFTDDYISQYYEIAWEYGHSHNVRHDENPYVIEANSEAERWLTGCYSTGWSLLGYTKTKKTAKQSKLIVYIGNCTCNCHEGIARGLIKLYQFFSSKCAEFDNRITEMVAAKQMPTIISDWKGASAA